MKRTTYVYPIFLFLSLISFLVLFFLVTTTKVQAQSCETAWDCPDRFTNNYCCGGNVCNDQLIGACTFTEADGYTNGNCTYNWGSTINHVDSCACGCSGGSCQACPTPTPVPEPTTPPVNYCLADGYFACTPGTSNGTCTLNGQTCTAYNTYQCNFDGQDYCDRSTCSTPCDVPPATPTPTTPPSSTPPPGPGPTNPPAGGCNVSWTISNSNPAPNTNITVAVQGVSDPRGWQGVNLRLDGGSAGITSNGIGNPWPTFNYTVNSGSAGSHSLVFTTNNNSYSCSPTASFTTVSPALPGPTNPSSSCNPNGPTATLSWTAVSGASGYMIRFDNKNPVDSPTWGAYKDMSAIMKESYACLGTSCSFTTGPSSILPFPPPPALPDLDIGYCANSNCSVSTEGPSNITANDRYTWDVQAIVPNESYPYAGTRTWGTDFTCTSCKVTGAICGLSTSNSITINNISLTDSGWGATGMSIQRGGNIIARVPEATTYTDSGLSPNTTYNYFVACYKDNGGGSYTQIGAAPVSCTTAAAPPALSTLNIRENNFDAPAGAGSGTYGKSGLRSNQSGGNYYNSLRIRQDLDSNSNSSNIALAAVGFGGKGGNAPYSTSLSALTWSANAGNGFVLLYAQNTADAYYFNGSSYYATKTFTAGNFYVYYNGGWYPTTGGYPPSNDIWQSISTVMEVKLPSDPTLPSGPDFQVRLYSPLGSRTWGTYGYILDTTGVSRGSSASLTPAYGP